MIHPQPQLGYSEGGRSSPWWSRLGQTMQKRPFTSSALPGISWTGQLTGQISRYGASGTVNTVNRLTVAAAGVSALFESTKTGECDPLAGDDSRPVARFVSISILSHPRDVSLLDRRVWFHFGNLPIYALTANSWGRAVDLKSRKGLLEGFLIIASGQVAAGGTLVRPFSMLDHRHHLAYHGHMAYEHPKG